MIRNMMYDDMVHIICINIMKIINGIPVHVLLLLIPIMITVVEFIIVYPLTGIALAQVSTG